MRDGKVIGKLATRDATAEALARMMVGREVLLRVQKKPADPRSPLLVVQRVCLKNRDGSLALDDISFEVRAGEILAVAGVEGNGQTELIEVLAGLKRPDSGEIILEGRQVAALGPHDHKSLGVAHIPEDRHRRGLLLDFDLAENSMLGVHYRPPVASASGLLNQTAINKRAHEIIENFDVRPPQAELPARALSGGNQQKLI